MINEKEAIEAATEELKKGYPDLKFRKAEHLDLLYLFPGKSGWQVWFEVEDPDEDPYDRPVEVDEETGEAQVVMLY